MKRLSSKRERSSYRNAVLSNAVEPLESRQMMSVTTLAPAASASMSPSAMLSPAAVTSPAVTGPTVGTTPSKGDPVPVYYVSGTAGNDLITVSYTSSPTTGRRLTIQRNAEPATIAVIGANDAIEIRGLEGNDVIRYSGSAKVVVRGGAGDDVITTGSGADVIYGDDGNDVMDGAGGGDNFYGGAGIDYADYSARVLPVTVTIDGQAYDGEAGEYDRVQPDTEGVRGGSNADVITGDAGANYLYGNGGNDVIHGGGGTDLVRGGAGDDVLYADAGFYDDLGGDAGNDRLYGGSGPDYLRGGAGDDVIVSIGGSQTDYVWGDAGVDSFWMDAESSEQLWDAEASETARNVHRVGGFESLKISGSVVQTPTRELLGQNLADPTVHKADYGYANFSTTPLFNGSGPSPDDVHQGNIGDCYFLAPLSAIAKTAPNVIRQSVVALGDGTFAVEMRRDGVRKFIRVDADMPVNASGNMAYAKNANGQLWVPLMEKAWALFRNSTGTYAGTDAGQAKEPYNALGISNDEYDPYSWFNDSPNEFANRLASLLSSGNAVTLCTDDGGGGILAEAHCYMVDHVNYAADGKVASIVLRNPWGYDGPSADTASGDGYVTLTPGQCLAACDVIRYGKA